MKCTLRCTVWSSVTNAFTDVNHTLSRTEHFHHSRKLHSTTSKLNPPLSHHPRSTYSWNCLLIYHHTVALPILELHLNGTNQYIFFCWILLLRKMFWRFNHVGQCNSDHSFKVLNSAPFYNYTTLFPFSC